MRRIRIVVHATALILLICTPLYIDPYNFFLLGHSPAMGILAIGIALVWGDAGSLPLRQGLFFGLGGYAVPMHLTLASLGPGGLPDFMQWNGLDSLPRLWLPFQSGTFSLIEAVLVPTSMSGALAWLVFHRRGGGVYFAIITQPLALAATTFIVSQQPYTGGFDGLTDSGSAFGFSLASQSAEVGLYWLRVIVLAVTPRAYSGCSTRSSADCCARSATVKTACGFSATIRRLAKWPHSRWAAYSPESAACFTHSTSA